MNLEKCLVRNTRSLYCYDMTDCSEHKKIIVLPKHQLILILSHKKVAKSNKKNYQHVRFYCNNVLYESFTHHFSKTFEIIERENNVH